MTLAIFTLAIKGLASRGLVLLCLVLSVAACSMRESSSTANKNTAGGKNTGNVSNSQPGNISASGSGSTAPNNNSPAVGIPEKAKQLMSQRDQLIAEISNYESEIDLNNQQAKISDKEAEDLCNTGREVLCTAARETARQHRKIASELSTKVTGAKIKLAQVDAELKKFTY